MAQWGKNDAASNSVLWAPQQMKQAPNTSNRDALFGNTTSNAYFDGVTIGQYGVDDGEIAANPAVAHTGWVLRTEGQGGRAGRVLTEVLVAGGMAGDAEDTAYPDYTLRVTTNPSSTSGNSSANETKTFTVAGASTPSGASLSYLWYYSTNGGTTYATTAAVSGFSGQTTTTLSVNTAILNTNTLVRAVVSATGAASVNSSAATLTVTA